MYDTIIVGAGQAGLATAYYLQQHNIRFLILEGSGTTAGSWPNYYESLKVFSPVGYSHLPGFAFPGEKHHYPSRQDVIDYLQAYAKHFAFPIKTESKVTSITKDVEAFAIKTELGDTYTARSVIDATGAFNQPYFPDIPNRSEYQGQVLHTFQYQRPDTFAGKRVLVIGAGNSAIQVAGDLVGTAQNVTIVSRSPIKLMPQKILGLDVHFFSRYLGLDKLRPRGAETGGKQPVQVIDTGNYGAMLASGAIQTMSMFSSFTKFGVQWTDGSVMDFDAVIYGTGYRPSYSHLPTEALNEAGRLNQNKGVSNLQGLYYMGQAFQRNFASATLRGVGSDAKIIVRHLRKYLKTMA